MKFIARQINTVEPVFGNHLRIDCDVDNYDDLLCEISEDIGDDVFMAWVNKYMEDRQMYVCVPCKKQMMCSKNGVGAEYGKGHVYPGDAFKCSKCGHEILATNGRPTFDPDHKMQDEYLQMEEE